MWQLAVAALVAGAATPARAAVPAAGHPRVLDAFEDSAPWSAVPASGVLMKLSSEPGALGRALRVDFDFQKGGGYAVLRRALDLPLPANYRFTVRVRGASAPQNFEFKLIDASGENVWWNNRRDFAFPGEWQTVATRKRQIGFAWGPAGGGDMTRVAAIEFAITAGSGGTGTVWLDELTFEELPPPNAAPPPIVARASSARARNPAAHATDGDTATAWRAAAGSRAWLELDLGSVREFGGLTLDWEPAVPVADYLDWDARARPMDYDVRVATEPGRFRTVREVRGGKGERDWLYLPDTEARWIRIETPMSTRAVALREVTLQPLAFGSSMNRFYEAIAKASPRGHFPRGIRGEQQFWAVVGTNGGIEEAFISEDGAVDLGTDRPSIEPFLWSEGRLWTWADVTSIQSLREDALPMPRVDWRGAPVDLSIEAFMAPSAEYGDELKLRYRVINRSKDHRYGRLLLAIRPFQVNPPAQFLNTPGGVCALGEIRRESPVGILIGRTRITANTESFGAAAFDEGDIVRFLVGGLRPERDSVRDSFGHASAVMSSSFSLSPGDSLVIQITERSLANAEPPPLRKRSTAAPVGAGSMAARWRTDLGPARISLPPSAREAERSLTAQIGWIAVNRDGPAIQPGSRAYARSWIRDGALTSSALLRWGRHSEVKAFLEWFAPFQYADGKVPCCVDRRGSDPVPEHDSHGQFIYLAAEYLRHTGDTVTVRRLWPNVKHAAGYLDTLRAQRLGVEWRMPEKREFFGILPPSISHEGYSAKPMHSYWDDFWAVRGYDDAVFLARALGQSDAARRFEISRTAFRRDFAASIAAARTRHKIAYVPGCADLGDFDATSTTMVLSPVQAAELAPAGSIEATFERYWDFFVRRRDGTGKWEAFTPYEIRNIGAFVRLGWRDRAHALLTWFLDHRSPPGWAQWAEVVYNAPTTARFVGDIPHTWVGSDYVRAILDMLAYERERDDALVIGAGVAKSWVREPPGVRVHALDTWYGSLSYEMRAEGNGLLVEIEKGIRIPRGGLVIAAPGVSANWRATVNGRPASVNARGEVIVRTLPAIVRLAPKQGRE
ncbi:MAG: discoidin domain-containing protein [Candidatus Eisenbacteria bacterium]